MARRAFRAGIYPQSTGLCSWARAGKRRRAVRLIGRFLFVWLSGWLDLDGMGWDGIFPLRGESKSPVN